MGLGIVFDIAKTALATQQTALNVTANNIANVNTEGYSCQTAVISTRIPMTIGNLQLGSGAEASQIVRSTNQFVEDQLMQQKSNMAAYEEMEAYVAILEGLFDESTGFGLSSMMTDFWNLWNDLSNNPSGDSERIALYEQSLLMTGQLTAMNLNLTQLETDISGAVTSGVQTVNRLTSEIASLNGQLVTAEAGGSIANDIRDQLNMAVSELSEYLNVDTFTQENGSISVVTAKGCILVQGANSYQVETGGSSGDRILWQGPGGTSVDITDDITSGKIGGWLTIRDETIAECKLDLDALANELIWAFNDQHTQGVGLKLFDPGITLTGTYQTGTDLDSLAYGDRIEFVADAFTLWIEDRTDPENPTMSEVSIDLSSLTGTASLTDLADLINTQISAAGLTGVSADGSGNSLSLISGSDHAFGFSGDQSGMLAALGINTYFQGVGAGSIGLNDTITDVDYIAAAQIDSAGQYASGDNTNALAIGDLQFRSMDIPSWTCDRENGNTQGSLTATIEGYYQSMVSAVGITANGIYNNKSASETMVNNLTSLRDSISAVSLDEEMANLIKFQSAYTAAAKLISVADEMIQSLLDVR